MEYEVVGKANDAQVLVAEERIAFDVMLLLLRIIVYGTIQFNYESKLGAVEIYDVAAELMLAPELQSQKFVATQYLPQHFLSRSLKVPQFTPSAQF
jgi:hypothetical protein